MSEPVHKTVLYDTHCALGAKIAPFGGFAMPIQYGSILREHDAARNGAAIFDTCHMGEFLIQGSGAEADLEKILTCSISDLAPGRCRYGFICNERGGVLDDQIVYRLGPDEFYMVVNAGTQEQDFAWISRHLGSQSRIQNRSRNTAKLDIQGPGAPRIVQRLLDDSIADMKFYRFAWNARKGRTLLVSRTGYTGEVGFELYMDLDMAQEIWDAAVEDGAVAAGLGARDTLRLEMGMPLYGHELDADTNPAQTGFTRAIAARKRFIGSDVVLDPRAAPRRLCGIRFESRRAARQHLAVTGPDGATIGTITSGSFSPSLQTAIALAYIESSHAHPGAHVSAAAGGVSLDGVITALPFYTGATGRMPLRQFLE